MKHSLSLAVLLLAWPAVAAGCAGGVGPVVDQEGPPGQGEREEPGGAVVAGSCAAGRGLADLVAEGTVERVRAGPDSSLAEIRLDRVLEGDARDTILVRTSSGTGAVAEHGVWFEEGARYRLRLQRQGEAFTTNACLGTRRVE